MGNLLRLLSRDDSNCCSPQKYDVFLDFENAQATDGEKALFDSVQELVLSNTESILNQIQQYKGAGKEIREAISNPSEDCQEKAWEAVVPLVAKLKRFYEFSLQIEQIVPKILYELCSGPTSPTQHLETQQALVKQFAEILEFVLKFDEYKMTTPAIQNDFSYYRRTVTRHRMACGSNGEGLSAADGGDDGEVSNDVANRMSLFYAHATPMLKVLSDATTTFVAENKQIPIENTTETLSTMAKVCQRMLENPDLIARFRREETQLFVLRVMVGLIILYDHVHPNGAFTRSANVDVKGCVKVLREQSTAKSEGLLNALRYTTKHLNDENTPKNIKTLLAA